MSKLAVTVSLVIAVVSTIAAIVLLRPHKSTAGSGGVVGSVLTSQQVADAVEIELEHRDGFAIEGNAWRRVVLSIDEFGTWWAEFFEHTQSAGVTFRWPVEESRVRSMVRVLGSTEVRPRHKDEEAEQRETLYRVGIRVSRGEWIRYRLSQPRLGGVVRATNENDRASSSDWPVEVFNGLFSPGPVAWLDTHCFAGVGEADKVTLRSSKGDFVLARSGSRWTMNSPVLSPVDDDAVSRLVTSIAALQADRLGPQSTSFQAKRLPHPIEIGVHASRTSSTQRTKQEQITLQTSVLPDQLGDNDSLASAMIQRSVTSETTAKVLTTQAQIAFDALTPVFVGPEHIISRVSVNHPATDIGAVKVITSDGVEATFARTLEGWMIRDVSGATTQLAPGMQSAVGELVRVLCEVRVSPEAIAFRHGSTDDAALAHVTEIELLTLSNLPLSRISAQLTPAEHKPESASFAGFETVCVDQTVARTYASGTLDVLVQQLVDLVRRN